MELCPDCGNAMGARPHHPCPTCWASVQLTGGQPAPETVVDAIAESEGRKSPREPRWTGQPQCWDIETGPLPEEELRAIYTPPTFEKFAAGCDQRWKPETVATKFEEALAKGWMQFVERAALSALTGRVLAIGVCAGGAAPGIIENGIDEWRLLLKFWDLCKHVADTGGKLVGFNIFGFDLPFLIRRSWVHHIAVPEWVLVNQRHWSPIFVDLMQVWGCGIYGERVKLDTLTKSFGISGKTGHGADFSRLWLGTAEEHQQAVAYLHRDIEITRGVALRMGVIE